MASSQTNGMRGVFLVASELARLGLIVSPTSRSARGADILATTQDCTRTYSVEVKTVTKNRFWQLAEHAKSFKSRSHIYVFVRIQKASKKKAEMITYYPVKAEFVAKNARLPDPHKTAKSQYRRGYSIDLIKVYKGSEGIERFQGNWAPLFER